VEGPPSPHQTLKAPGNFTEAEKASAPAFICILQQVQAQKNPAFQGQGW